MNNRLISYNCTKIQTPIVQNKYKQKIQTLSGNYDVSAFPKKVNDISHLLFLQRKLHHRQLPGSYIYLNNKSSNILKSYLIHRMLLLLIACIAIQTISNDTVSSYHWLLWKILSHPWNTADMKSLVTKTWIKVRILTKVLAVLSFLVSALPQISLVFSIPPPLPHLHNYTHTKNTINTQKRKKDVKTYIWKKRNNR